jgi:hypothetical protein
MTAIRLAGIGLDKRRLRASEASTGWPSPDYAFMRGVIYASTGECHRARRAMDEYLAGDPAPVDALAARQRLGICAENPTASTPSPPPSPPPATTWFASRPPGSPPAPDALPTPHPWYRDPAGGVLLAAGGAFALAGTSLAITARFATRDEPASYAEFDAQNRRHQRLQIASGITLATGSALLVGAVIRYVMVTRRGGLDDRRSARSAARRLVWR